MPPFGTQISLLVALLTTNYGSVAKDYLVCDSFASSFVYLVTVA